MTASGFKTVKTVFGINITRDDEYLPECEITVHLAHRQDFCCSLAVVLVQIDGDVTIAGPVLVNCKNMTQKEASIRVKDEAVKLSEQLTAHFLPKQRKLWLEAVWNS